MRFSATFALLGISHAASAIPLDLTYTVMGQGGLSQPLPGVTSERTWWIDSTGAISAATATSRGAGFEPFQAFDKVVDQWGQGGGGSLLLSSSFQVAEGETLVIDYSMITGRAAWLSMGDVDAPIGFALLLQNGSAPIVLSNMNAEQASGLTAWGVDNPANTNYLSPQDRAFAQTSAGVNVTGTQSTGIDITLNDLHYGTIGPGQCGCLLDVTSVYTPGAGDFQLLFGVYNLFGPGTPSPLADSALVVRGVTSVPEPATITLLGVGLIPLLWKKRLAHRLHHVHNNHNSRRDCRGMGFRLQRSRPGSEVRKLLPLATQPLARMAATLLAVRGSA